MEIKKIVVCFVLIFCFMTVSCNHGTFTPVVFIHGISSYGGTSLFYLYEQFAAQGYPEDVLYMPVLPRYGAGPAPEGDPEFAWIYFHAPKPYQRADWEKSGDTMHNLPFMKNYLDDVLSTTGAEKVDLIGHSNGSTVIRLLLADPYYGKKIGKVIILSGFCDTSGVYDVNMVTSYLQDVTALASLPADVAYYAISSESDLNAANVNPLAGTPSNGNQPPFDENLFFFDETIGTNHNVYGRDHQQVVVNYETFEKAFEWITGFKPVALTPRFRIEIGGTIVKRYANGYLQTPQSEGTVTVNYYDPFTGMELGAAGTSLISAQGRYSISNIRSDQHLKIIIEANGARSVYFLADKIQHNSGALDFIAPEPIASDNADGQLGVAVATRNEYLSRGGYANTPGDTFSGKIILPDASEINLDSSVVTTASPSSKKTILLQNFGATDTDAGGDLFNFDAELLYDVTSSDVCVIANLNNRGDIAININGADRSNNISNYILYLYE